jgi:hypothetical protein
LFAVTCGFGSAATIEILKRIVGFRGMYQRRQTERWLEERSHSKDRDSFSELKSSLGADAYGKPIIAKQQQARLFNLPTEQLAAQIGAALELAVAMEKYPDLVACFAGQPTESPNEDRLELAQRVRSGIDQLQISLGEGWRRAVQSAALWIAGWYGVGLTHVVKIDDRAEASYILGALVIGGVFAWVARDVAAFIERARR